MGEKSGWGGAQQGNRTLGTPVRRKEKVTARHKRIYLQSKKRKSTNPKNPNCDTLPAFIPLTLTFAAFNLTFLRLLRVFLDVLPFQSYLPNESL